MKNLLIGIIVAIVGAIFVFYLNFKKADIRYSLSEKIPVRFLEENSQESIQQLTVKNNGNSEAKKIKIDLKGQVIDYDIFPYSKADQIEKFQSKNSLEIVYSSLPPEANFKIIIKTSGDEIDENDLIIAHNEGSGKAALTKDNNSFLSLILPVGGIAYLLFLAMLGVKETWEFKAKYSFDELLKRKKPFYLGKEKWDSLRKRAIEEKLSRPEFRSIERSTSYSVLSTKKPDYLSDEEWKKLIHTAAESFTTLYANKISRCFEEKEILELLMISKPEYLSETEWTEIQKKINDKYFDLKQRRFYSNQILIRIKDTKPEKINSDLWLEYQKNLLKKYVEFISTEMKTKKEPIEFLQKQDLSTLTKEDVEDLYENAYKLQIINISTNFLGADLSKKFEILNKMKEKPEKINSDIWDSCHKNLLKIYIEHVSREMEITKEPIRFLKEQDLSFLTKREVEILQERAYKLEFNNISTLFLDTEKAKKFIEAEKPFWLKDSDYEAIKKKASTILESERILKENIDLKTNLLSEVKETTILKNKIENQLRFINEVLNDPNAADRIEEYNDVFAPGNLKNLKKLAEISKGA